MISTAAWSASDRSKWGKQAVGPGIHRVLLALWNHAHDWAEGEGIAEWFVWPSVSTIGARFGLGDDAVRRCLRELAARGWLRPDTNEGRRGWWLRADPTPAAPQLELFAADVTEPTAVDAPTVAPEVAPPVDNLCTDGGNHRAARDEPSRPARQTIALLLSTGTELNVSEARASARGPDDDDVQRVWSTYETERVRVLGGTVREGPAPLALRVLVAELGLPAVERYAARSLVLAADAVKRGRDCAATLVIARSDGHEWHPRRVDAVARFPDPPAPLQIASRPPPAPDPVVDGERVTLHEREAYEFGGDEGVRAQRAELAARPTAGVAHIEAWLRDVRGKAGGSGHV